MRPSGRCTRIAAFSSGFDQSDAALALRCTPAAHLCTTSTRPGHRFVARLATNRGDIQRVVHVELGRRNRPFNVLEHLIEIEEADHSLLKRDDAVGVTGIEGPRKKGQLLNVAAGNRQNIGNLIDH